MSKLKTRPRWLWCKKSDIFLALLVIQDEMLMWHNLNDVSVCQHRVKKCLYLSKTVHTGSSIEEMMLQDTEARQRPREQHSHTDVVVTIRANHSNAMDCQTTAFLADIVKEAAWVCSHLGHKSASPADVLTDKILPTCRHSSRCHSWAPRLTPFHTLKMFFLILNPKLILSCSAEGSKPPISLCWIIDCRTFETTSKLLCYLEI